MRDVFGPRRRRRDAQTFVFFALTFGTIFLLCGLAIDSGLLFLAKARMARAVDGASLAAVGNFNAGASVPGATPQTIRAAVAAILRNIAVANYTDLSSTQSGSVASYPIASTATEQASSYTTTTGQTAYTYTYNFNDGTQDANGAYRKYVKVILTTGSGGQITSAETDARCPVNTFFIGALSSYFRDLKVSASATATRNPRLIMIVVDRSGSMLSPGGGAYGLPQAVVQFLDFFDTSSDYIGIVSFGSSARLEMPLTTNFIIAGTNVLFDSYQTNNGVGIPGADPEEFTSNGYSATEVADYAYSGVRRLKFGGTTAADEGIRLAMEQLMANTGFNDPDVVKYMVIFTDGAWNETRTLLAAPPYTNWLIGPTNGAPVILTNATATGWSTNLANDTKLMMMPTFCESNGVSDLTNSIGYDNSAYENNGDFSTVATNHYSDIWQSSDGTHEPITTNDAGPFVTLEGAPMSITNNDLVGMSNGVPMFSRYVDVWLQPGAVDYYYHNNAVTATYVSDLTNPTNHVSIKMVSGDSNELVVPGYVVDGLFFDGLDLETEDNHANGHTTFPKYRLNNYQEYFMWPDDTIKVTTQAQADSYTSGNSLERQLMFRNYPNLLTGFYVTRPDEPLGPAGDTNQYTGATNAAYGLGPYYPAAGFYWPFDLVGVDFYETYGLTNATEDPDPYQSGALGGNYNGGSRHESYSINMLTNAAAPEWSGEWFFEGTGGTNVISSPNNSSVSSLMSSKAAWQSNAPAWVLSDFDANDEKIMTNETAHNTNVISSAQIWRPWTFNGSNSIVGVTNNFGNTVNSLITSWNSSHGGSKTGGYVIDGSGTIYANSMAWSGRPTHYFDFSQSKWIPIQQNHVTNSQALQLGVWKAQEYAWHARAAGVTIFTVGYGFLVSQAQQVVLAQIANATNTTAGNVQSLVGTNFTYVNTGGTGITYNPNQPIGQQFFATNSPNQSDISNDFYSIGQAINAALTQ